MRRKGGWTLFYLYERGEDGDELLAEFDTERQALDAAYRLPDDVAWCIEESTVFPDGTEDGRTRYG